MSGAFSLVELLVVVSIISLLIGLLMPAAGQVRQRARAVKCIANLRGVGQAVHSFASAHDDYAAAVVRERDFYWDRGKQIGWDIETGRWAGVLGGPGTMWQCPVGIRSYVGNSRALGLDNREVFENGSLHRVGPRQWYEPARLILAYDVQPNLITVRYKRADEPMVGDLSDEMDGRWPRDATYPLVAARLGPYGPHDSGKFGVLFADGHAVSGTLESGTEAVFWSGLRWWSVHYQTVRKQRE